MILNQFCLSSPVWNIRIAGEPPIDSYPMSESIQVNQKSYPLVISYIALERSTICKKNGQWRFRGVPPTEKRRMSH